MSTFSLLQGFMIKIPMMSLTLMVGHLPLTGATQPQAEQSKICPELAGRISQEKADRYPAIVSLSTQYSVSDSKDAQMRQMRQMRLLAYKTQSSIIDSLRESQSDIKDVRAFWVVNAISLRAPPRVLRRLANREDVASVCLPAKTIARRHLRVDRDQSQCVSHYGSQLRKIKQRYPHLTGKGIVVAIVDSGIRPDHPGLRGSLWENPRETLGNFVDDDKNGYQDDLFGYDFLKCAVDLCDGLGGCPSNPPSPIGNQCAYTAAWGAYSHGTMVAGRIVKSGYGIAPKARLMSLRALGDDRKLSETASWHALEYAITEGAQIVNLSVGFSKNEVYDSSRRNWQAIVKNAQRLGVILVAAAGNDGNQFGNRSIRTPGEVPEIITVGSIDYKGNFSDTSQGPVDWFNDTIAKPDLVAIGDEVCTLGWSGNQPLSAVPGNGTSLAAPVVSATLALMLQAWPKMTPEAAKECLLAATDHSGLSTAIAGQGRLKVVDAIKKAIAAKGGTPCS